MSTSAEPRNLGDLVQVDGADIYDGDNLIATLRSQAGSTVFAYDAEWRAAHGRPASLSLPIDGPRVVRPARGIPAALAGLLPEGRRLTATRAALKTSPDDELSLLLAVGTDVVGHLQIVEPGELPSHLAVRHDMPPSPSRLFSEVFAEAVGREPERVGLAGIQDKVSGAMISLPVNWADHAAILKLNPPEFPWLVENEAFFLGMARECELRTNRFDVVHDSEGAAGLLLERFDRVQAGGSVLRRPCEDGCQVLGRYPAEKYAIGTEELFRGLADRTAAPVLSNAAFFRQFLFAVLTGNGDAHAKNFSLLFADGEWTVSPAYDLPSTYPYGDSTLALSVEGKRRDQISRRMALDVAASLGLRPRAAANIVDDVIERSAALVGQLDELPFDSDRLRRLRRFLTARRRSLMG